MSDMKSSERARNKKFTAHENRKIINKVADYIVVCQSHGQARFFWFVNETLDCMCRESDENLNNFFTRANKEFFEN